MSFRLPGPSDRIVILGPTGSGKTVFGGWVLAQQNMKRRPWVCIDFKSEELWDEVGDPPMRPLRLGQMPGKSGLYRLEVLPGEEDDLEDWLWKVWHRGNIGLFCDEVSLMPQKRAYKAILRQGRSKLIPVISCSQRPVDCDREVFTEAQYRVIFGVEDLHRDYQVIRGLFGNIDVRDALIQLPERWSIYYDTRQKRTYTLRPVPPPATIAAQIKASAPVSWWHGF